MRAKEELAKLQAAKLPRLSWGDVLSVTGEGSLTPEEETVMSEYFSRFVKTEGGKCVCCGSQQGGDEMAALFGTAKFRWGIAHGEGVCSECGYPARAYHFDVGPIKRLSAILQYHPEELQLPDNPQSGL